MTIKAEIRYVSLTALAEKSGRRLSKWVELDSTKDFLKSFRSDCGTPPIVTKRGRSPVELLSQESLSLSDIISGNIPAGTWAHPVVGQEFCRWLSKSSPSQIEDLIQAELYKEVGGSREVECPVGLIDIVTSREIVEVKIAKSWKAAMGQILAYSVFFPEHQPVVALFGWTKKDPLIVDVCTRFGVDVWWLTSDIPQGLEF